MDSINQTRTEEHREDLRGSAALSKLREIVKQAPTCFFCTAVPTGESSGSRPMNVREVDDEGNLWFLSANDSHTNQELILDHSKRRVGFGLADEEGRSATSHQHNPLCGDDLTVRPYDDLERVIREEDVVVGVLAVPTEAAQEVADDLVEAGVKIIFNYSEALLQVPPEVTVHTSSPAVDLLYALYFYLT